jgi:hypothetical protein
MRDGKEDAMLECFDWSGRRQKPIADKKWAGKVTVQEERSLQGSMVPYRNRHLVCTHSKSRHTKPAISLEYEAAQGKGVVQMAETSGKREPISTMTMPGAQRAFDVDSRQKYFALLRDRTRDVVLYTFGQEQPVATYTPPSPRCRPSDV